MSLISQLVNSSKAFITAWRVPGEPTPKNNETGRRTTPESALKAIYNGMWVDPDLRGAILEIRSMDKADGRVKRIHGKIASDIIRGGLTLTNEGGSAVIKREWDAFHRRLQLNRVAKLKSDARNFVMQGNLGLQWVLDDQLNVVLGVNMPAETLTPNAGANGQFRDLQKAWKQIDMQSGQTLAEFPLWKLSLARLDPDSHDDLSTMGRPYMDASRSAWQKLTMSEEDLVIRRRTRAPQKLVHILEGASEEELLAYQKKVEKNAADIATDYYTNKAGGVTAIQGDQQMGQIDDVIHLMDTFFSGVPLPKHLVGYIADLPRDALEEIKRSYFDDLDYMQDEQAYLYNQGFELHLLLKGINPADAGYCLKFAERRTETQSQTVDRMLKWMALGLPLDLIYEELGLDPSVVAARKKDTQFPTEPYPGGAGGDMPAKMGPDGKPIVKVTPGNGRNGDSATSINSA